MIRRASLLLCFVLSVTSASFSQSSRPIDHSTPQSAYDALVDAIRRDDAAEVTRSYYFTFKLSAAQEKSFGENVIANTQLYWALLEKFNAEITKDLVDRAPADTSELPPCVKGESLSWRPRQVSPEDAKLGITNRGGFKMPVMPERYMQFVQTEDGWQLDCTSLSSELLDYIMQTAGMTIRRVRKTTDGIRSGEISSEADVREALRRVPAPVSSTQPADRSTPQGAMSLLHQAYLAGDIEAALDGFNFRDESFKEYERAYIDQQIVLLHLHDAVAQKFGQIRAAAVPRSVDPFQFYESDGWEIDSDVAQGIFDGKPWILSRMVRKDNVWRISLMPASPSLGGASGMAGQVKFLHQETDRYRYVLEHLSDYPTIGAVLVAVDDLYKDRDSSAEVEIWRQAISEARTTISNEKFADANEEFKAEADVKPYEIYVATMSQDAAAAAKHFMCTGDDGSYLLAREQRVIAVAMIEKAARRENLVESFGYEFGLRLLADSPFRTSISWSVKSDVATGTPNVPDFSTWIPPIRKISGVWKIDVTDEVHGNPKMAAASENQKARRLDAMRARIEKGEFESLDQLRQAMRSAGF